MKTRLVTILMVLALAGCGSHEESATGAAEGAANHPETPRAASTGEAEPGAGPCTALDVEWNRYEAAGKPMAYTFEYPSGWDINELFMAGATSIDITMNLDEQPIPEFILRFGHVVDKQMDNPLSLVETWKKMPMTEEILEIDVEGRTMYVAKNRIGEMIGFQALFPDVRSDSKAWMVSGGVTNAPTECRDEAIAAVERVIRSFAPNRDIGPPPVQ